VWVIFCLPKYVVNGKCPIYVIQNIFMNIEIYFYEKSVGILPTRHLGKIQSRPCMRRQLTILLVTRYSLVLFTTKRAGHNGHRHRPHRYGTMGGVILVSFAVLRPNNQPMCCNEEIRPLYLSIQRINGQYKTSKSMPVRFKVVRGALDYRAVV
jgi:hypothetical protein